MIGTVIRPHKTLAKPLTWLGALLLVAGLCGCQRDICGTYLASDRAAVCWIQIVRTPDNHLDGQLATSILKPDGGIEHIWVLLSGTIQGENVALTGKSLWGVQTVALSGSLRDKTLALAGTLAIPGTFERSSMADYKSKESELAGRSERIISAKAAVDVQHQTPEATAGREISIEAIDDLVGRMSKFDSEIHQHLVTFPSAEEGYQSITARLAQYVADERELAKSPNRSVMRGDLSVAAMQTPVIADQLHKHALLLDRSLQTDVIPIADELRGLMQECHAPAPEDLHPSQIQAWNAACERLSDAAEPFQQTLNATATGLANLEQAYDRERAKQGEILRQAENLNSTPVTRNQPLSLTAQLCCGMYAEMMAAR